MERSQSRALWLLVLGSGVGVLLGVLAGRDPGTPIPQLLPADAIALVSGRPIRKEEYGRALTLFAGDKRSPLTQEDRAHVLKRLIEEELLVQEGIRMGLVDSDPSVRQTLTRAMLDSAMAESLSTQPSEDTLKTFYQKNRALFEPDQGAGPPVFETIRGQVEEVYLRRVRDRTLNEYLGWLRERAEIVFAPELFP